MSSAAPRPWGRRLGYVIGLAVNVALLYVINVEPGWQSLSFVTPSAADVVPVANLSLMVGALVDGVYLVVDIPVVKAFGDLVTSAFAFAVAWKTWDVFPFDFSGTDFDWTPVVRVLLVVAMIGSAVGAVAAVVRVLRAAGDNRS